MRGTQLSCSGFKRHERSTVTPLESHSIPSQCGSSKARGSID